MKKLKKWEYALIIGLVSAVVAGFITVSRDMALEDKLLRLHVIGASDSESDQELKLKVRDAVLEICQPILAQSESVELSKELLESHKDEIQTGAERVIRENGFDYGAKVELTTAMFDTREYENFSLPAGSYQTLRVTLGEGSGRNWWCVVFPPLCAEAATGNLKSSAAAAGLDSGDIALITKDSDQYVLRFKLIEWLGNMKKKLLKK